MDRKKHKSAETAEPLQNAAAGAGRARWIVGAAALAVAVVAVAVMTAATVRGGSDKPVAVSTAQASLKQVSAAGVVAGRSDSDVFAAVEGRVARVLVEDQQSVRRGDALVVLDDEPYAVAKAQALSAIRQAEATLDALEDQAPSDGEIAAARSAVKAATEQRSAARAAVEDAEKRSFPEAELRALRAGSATASAALKQAKAARSRLSVASDTSRERSAARAALAAAKLAYAKAKHDLNNLTVRAPDDGVVFLAPVGSAQGPGRDVVVGQGVSPATPLLRVVDVSALRFVADVDQDDISLVKRGQRVLVTLDALSDRTFDATATFVSLDSRTSRSGATVFRVEADLPAGAAGIRLGMEGTAGIGIGGSASAVRIPQQAVVRRDGEAVVFVVDDGVAREHKVSLGSAIGSEYEVTSGIAPGESVATSGLADLADGARVVTE